MIKVQSFKYPSELVEFCNIYNITKENIITLIFEPQSLFSYKLFYETNN